MRTSTYRRVILALLLSPLLPATALAVDVHKVSSPDGKISVTIQATNGLAYAVELDGAPLLAPSRLGLAFEDGMKLGENVQVIDAKIRANNTSWKDDFGRFRTVKDRYRELTVRLRENRPALAEAVDFSVLVRAYDDGVALRYVLPEQMSLGKFKLVEDRTEFLFPADHRAWLGSAQDSESLYPEIRLSQTPGDRRILPLVVETPSALVAVGEADVRDWSGSFITSPGKPGVFGGKAALASPVESTTPRESAWHALIIARTAAELTVSTLLANLATPSQLKDTSWIKPGISAWDAWWTGRNRHWDQYKGLESRGNTQSHKDYIDFAAEMGWPYMLVDWFWYDQESPDPETAIKPQSHINMPELMAYAKSKGVKLILWANSKNIPSIGADKLFATYAEWGAAGVKIDFFPNNGSQATQRWMEELVIAAAKHQLVVNFHGVYTATGLSRTWPNLLTQEGVMGVEYLKLAKTFDVSQMIMLPFTRCLLGPADVTPGAFLNVREDEFVPNSIPATCPGTRSRQLALAVLADSPFLCLCDDPENYRGQPGIGFYRNLPTTWDETRAVSAEIMKHLVQVRRKGKGWWIAGMNHRQPLEIDIKLDFLGEGSYVLTTYADAPESTQSPTALVEFTREVKRGETLRIRMEIGGGFAATLQPKN